MVAWTRTATVTRRSRAFVATGVGCFVAWQVAVAIGVPRLAIGGFVGLPIVGVTYHFYPPAVASTAGIGDRTARWSVTALLGGLGLEVGGSLASASPLVWIGPRLSVLGAMSYAAVLWTIFLERSG